MSNNLEDISTQNVKWRKYEGVKKSKFEVFVPKKPIQNYFLLLVCHNTLSFVVFQRPLGIILAFFQCVLMCVSLLQYVKWKSNELSM